MLNNIKKHIYIYIYNIKSLKNKSDEKIFISYITSPVNMNIKKKKIFY